MAKKEDVVKNNGLSEVNIPYLSSEKNTAISKAMADIEKAFGKGAVMLLGAKSNEEVEVISTGSIGLDLALGIGGVPRGRVIEIYGPERFIISQPDNGEMALEIAEALIKSSAIDVLIIDSVAALVPRAEIDGEMGDSHIGLQARLMSQGLRKLVGLIKKNNCIVIFINQLREKVGTMFGNPETTPGGRALKFYSSVRLDVRKIDSIKQGEGVVGNRTRVKVIKNKVAPPFKQAEFDIMYGKGIDRIGEIIDIGVKENIITKSGAWFSYCEERLGQGREKGKEYLKENPEILKKIESQLYEKINSKSNERAEKINSEE